MCGIIGIHFKNTRDKGVSTRNLERLIDEMLLGIEHRGRDATGLLTVDAKGVPNLVKADVDASTFINWRENIPRKVRTILGHTRMATQGTPQNLDNNHPVQYGTCFAIHNGHIANDTELFGEHSLGRHAEVDSEIIPALFDKYGLDKAHLALQELEGGYATAVVDPDRYPNVTVLAKGWNSPVEVLETKHGVIFASVPEAIQDACEKVLGFRPASSKIESLMVGDLLFMEGETVERLEFKPKARYTRSAYSTSTVTHSSTNYYSSTEAIERSKESGVWTECKSCGHGRISHGSGNNFEGACTKVQPGSNFHCRCIAFVEPKNDAKPIPEDEVSQAHAWEYCDGCGRVFYIGDLVLVGNKYLCPSLCAKDPVVAPGPTASDLRKRAEDVVIRQLAAAEEFGVGEVDGAAWEVREEAFNEHVCAIAAEKTGMDANYVNWLVNECGSDLPDSDSTGYLSQAKQIAGKAYWIAWWKLDDEVAEIDATRFQQALSGVSSGNACDTVSDDMAEIISIHEEVIA